MGCLFEGLPLREHTLSGRTLLRGRAPTRGSMEQQSSRGVVLRTQRVSCDARVACTFSTSLSAHTVEIRDRSTRRCTDFRSSWGATARVGQTSGEPGEQTLRRLLGRRVFEPGLAGAIRGGFRREEPDAQPVAPAISRDTGCIEAARDAR
jgi:hypothetical protein